VKQVLLHAGHISNKIDSVGVLPFPGITPNVRIQRLGGVRPVRWNELLAILFWFLFCE
jgi:hypothetical protein